MRISGGAQAPQASDNERIAVLERQLAEAREDIRELHSTLRTIYSLATEAIMRGRG